AHALHEARVARPAEDLRIVRSEHGDERSAQRREAADLARLLLEAAIEETKIYTRGLGLTRARSREADTIIASEKDRQRHGWTRPRIVRERCRLPTSIVVHPNRVVAYRGRVRRFLERDADDRRLELTMKAERERLRRRRSVGRCRSGRRQRSSGARGRSWSG